ncbi:ATP-dependent RNA helicase TDRD9-like [Gigantopelta aegis]|uniref:ATP-dependent RNA helicase TDRD9-like n=1 Tax=Gigantopelta aegis TaxID=1735272 RepID=UPI001B887B23|nr:ATP-dependent RNA helicase TDRD9-like [Gigantopelta aegis]
MSRITAELTLNDIDDWFKIGKKAAAKIASVPSSKTGGRRIDPKTGEACIRPVDLDAFVPQYKRQASRQEDKNYAAVYQAQEEDELLRPTLSYPLSTGSVASLAGTIEQLDLDSTVGGSSTTVPEDLVPPGATDVYNNYSFRHTYDPKLPITSFRDQVIATIESNQVTVIQGSTGSGKTTQVPQYILDHYAQENKFCNIVVTQPRRIAVTSICRRVCQERNWDLGTVCGYQIGMDSKRSEDTRILYCTTGVLREKLVHKKSMSEFTHVILDEVHERNQDSDFSLLIVRKLLRTVSRHVKVILMSATIESDLFANYFALPVRDRLEPAPVVSVEGRVFRVSEFYADDLSSLGEIPELHDSEPHLNDLAVDMAIRLIREFDNLEMKEQGRDPDTGFSPVRGTVLCFLPGYGEIDDIFTKLRQHQRAHELTMIPLHSTVTSEEQMEVFRPAQPGKRKVILSTNIAESSITVPDIKYVIDFCLTKNLVCDPDTNFTQLQVEWASKANCTQRKGRAGRVSNGRVYFMVTRNFFENYLPDYGIPEMQRCPLEQLVLKAKLFNMGEPKAILGLALSPPNLDDIERTVLNLKEVGALSTPKIGYDRNRHDGELTFIGRVLADLPVDIHVGKMLMLGHVFGLLEECLIIGAAMSLKNIFAKPFHGKLDAFRHKFGWAAYSFSDSLAILYAYKIWDNKKKLGEFRRSGQNQIKWGKANFIQIRRINEVAELIKEMEQRLYKFNIQKPRLRQDHRNMGRLTPEERLILKIVIGGAFYPNYFLRNVSSETDAIRELSNNDPLSTVVVKGLPANQGMLYHSKLDSIFQVCQADPPPSITFEETKAFIKFPWKQGMKSDQKVHEAVYMALKLRLLRFPLEVDIYSREDALLMMTKLCVLQNEAASSGKLRTNRIKAPAINLDQEELAVAQVVRPPQSKTSYIKMYITEVVECGHFWAQYVEHESTPAFGQLQYELNANQWELLQPIMGNVMLGSYVVAPFKDQSVAYYRARVERIEGQTQNSRIQVFFLDYGNSEKLVKSQLKLLPEKYLRIPFQACECFLTEIRPSSVKCPDGVWSHAANETFRDMVLGKQFYARIYSIVRDTLRVELTYNDMFKNMINIASELKRFNFAEAAEESFLSKQSHDELAADEMCPQSNRDDAVGKGHKDNFVELGITASQLREMKTRGRKIRLVGPNNPLEMNFSCMTFIGRMRTVRIDPDSVNCVAVDDDPQNPHQRLMVTGFVGLNPTGSTVVVRDTTLMPMIPGLPALLALLFAPCAEFRTDPKRKHYIGAICGLGYDPETGYSILPDHDMEMEFDTEINVADISKINGIRMAINIAIGTRDTVAAWSSDAVVRIQNSACTKLLELLTKRREFIDVEGFERPYQWDQVDPDYVLEDVKSELESDEVMLLNKHCAIELDDADEPVRRSDQLKLNVQLLHETVNTNRHDALPVMCELCHVNCPKMQFLHRHMNSTAHNDRERKLFEMYDHPAKW